MAEVALKVNGKSYSGWKSVRITRGIEAICGGFELGVSDRWAGQQVPWPILEEDECEIAVDGQTIITGYVDRRSISLSSDEHSLRVSGRDKAGALIDNSAVLKVWEFNSISLLTLAKRLADPFGVSVALAPGLHPASISAAEGKSGGKVSGAGKDGATSVGEPPKKFTIDPGESAFEVLERACRMVGVLPVSDGAGGILLTRAGSARAATALVEGQNILAISADYDASSRYRRYIVAAQQHGTDEAYGAIAAAVRAEAVDSEVRRAGRVLYVRPEAGTSAGLARTRAQWEAKVRASRGDAVTVTVPGWKQANGQLWPVNALAQLKSPTIGMDADLLITQAIYTIDDGGEVTQLSLKRRDAFIPEPTVGSPALANQIWKELRHGVPTAVPGRKR
jgi:prophage tail gpP-like protein